MSTRCTTHFTQTFDGITTTEAIIYRHTDGYPTAAAVDIFRFFHDVHSQTADTRFNDASYLAAKYVVWLANQFRGNQLLDFLSVGVCSEDPMDIEYRYTIDCSSMLPDGFPDVRCCEYMGPEVSIQEIRNEMIEYAR